MGTIGTSFSRKAPSKLALSAKKIHHHAQGQSLAHGIQPLRSFTLFASLRLICPLRQIPQKPQQPSPRIPSNGQGQGSMLSFYMLYRDRGPILQTSSAKSSISRKLQTSSAKSAAPKISQAPSVQLPQAIVLHLPLIG